MPWLIKLTFLPPKLLRVVRNPDILALLGTPKETAEFFLTHLRKSLFHCCLLLRASLYFLQLSPIRRPF